MWSPTWTVLFLKCPLSQEEIAVSCGVYVQEQGVDCSERPFTSMKLYQPTDPWPQDWARHVQSADWADWGRATCRACLVS